ncbi:hypothetical protein CF336_g9551, partial [Tilletia laevis]
AQLSPLSPLCSSSSIPSGQTEQTTAPSAASNPALPSGSPTTAVATSITARRQAPGASITQFLLTVALPPPASSTSTDNISTVIAST